MHLFKHFSMITRHRHKVIAHCFKAGIPWQGLWHDMSKYSLTEFIPGIKCYMGDKSPNEKERELYGFSRAWLHHQGRNKHHFEYWVDYSLEDTEHVINGAKMPRKYVAEMIMDRISASRNYLGDGRYTDRAPYEYFMKNKDELWFIHRDTIRDLEALLHMLADKGEDKTLAYIRHVYLKKRPKKRK